MTDHDTTTFTYEPDLVMRPVYRWLYSSNPNQIAQNAVRAKGGRVGVSQPEEPGSGTIYSFRGTVYDLASVQRIETSYRITLSEPVGTVTWITGVNRDVQADGGTPLSVTLSHKPGILQALQHRLFDRPELVREAVLRRHDGSRHAHGGEVFYFVPHPIVDREKGQLFRAGEIDTATKDRWTVTFRRPVPDDQWADMANGIYSFPMPPGHDIDNDSR